MSAAAYPFLQAFIERFADNVELQHLRSALNIINHNDASCESLNETISIYQQALPVIENIIWSCVPDEFLISQYQGMFCEFEALIALRGSDHRHSFIIVIPVADRPKHLSQCLASLLTLCQLYQYGSTTDSIYNKIHVIVADDSKQQNSIKQHKALCEKFSSQGLITEYFGASEQIRQLEHIKNHDKEALRGILGEYVYRTNISSFYHKGAAVTRNITYLRTHQLIRDNAEKNYLIYLIDSDQEFKINVVNKSKYNELYAINYFYQLDKIFTQSNVQILTGKVVGDPPVSPAVMAANFLDDVIAFVTTISATQAEQACSFHNNIPQQDNDAAYHDMSNLFGFSKAYDAIEYHCPLQIPHNHIACFNAFASSLNNFFDGAHPTRSTSFNYTSSFSDTTAARTIYTGNYVLRPESLKYFIAFSTLKLRMAGPVLGRLLKSEIQDKFVSANLPMLHKRTIDTTGKSEFRPGVNHNDTCVDLSSEFERQYYGDIMLFTIDKLTKLGYPVKQPANDTVTKAFDDTASEIHQQYAIKLEQVISKLDALKSVFYNQSHWWNSKTTVDEAKKRFTQFIANIENNYSESSRSYTLINSASHHEKRRREILQALVSYQHDQTSWRKLLQ